jgi:hypothetical protein
MPGPRRVRRFQLGGSAENAGERRQPNTKLVESYMTRQGMSEEQKANYRRMLGLPQQVPTESPRKTPRSPLAQAVRPKKKKPIVRRPSVPRQAVQATRRAAPVPTPPPPPPVSMQPPEQDGMLGETMNAIQQRQQMLQGLKRGGPVKKKAAPRRVVRAKRRR